MSVSVNVSINKHKDNNGELCAMCSHALTVHLSHSGTSRVVVLSGEPTGEVYEVSLSFLLRLKQSGLSNLLYCLVSNSNIFREALTSLSMQHNEHSLFLQRITLWMLDILAVGS